LRENARQVTGVEKFAGVSGVIYRSLSPVKHKDRVFQGR